MTFFGICDPPLANLKNGRDKSRSYLGSPVFQGSYSGTLVKQTPLGPEKSVCCIEMSVINRLENLNIDFDTRHPVLTFFSDVSAFYVKIRTKGQFSSKFQLHSRNNKSQLLDSSNS